MRADIQPAPRIRRPANKPADAPTAAKPRVRKALSKKAAASPSSIIGAVKEALDDAPKKAPASFNTKPGKAKAKVGVKKTVKISKPKRDLLDRATNAAASGAGKAASSFDVTSGARKAIKASTGIKIPGAGDIAKTALLASGNVLRATAEHPSDVATHTVKGIPALAAGTVAGLAAAVTHPKTLKDLPAATAADYKRRYGNLADDPAAFRKRIRKEGALSEIVDAASIAVPEGAILGKGLGKAARAGALGDKAKALASMPRPKLRVTAGPSGAIDQELSDNLGKVVAQRAKDKARARASERRVTRKGEARGLQPGEGEVVRKPTRTIPGVPSAQARGQRRVINADQARANTRLQRAKEREIDHGSRKEVGTLNKHEKRALKYSIQMGLPADHAAAARELAAHRAAIVKHRAEGNVTVRRHDELPNIDKILADPEKHLTPRLRAVADKQVARAKRTGEMDPNLEPDAATIRQHADQASHLGVKRGGTPIEEAVSDASKRLTVAKNKLYKAKGLQATGAAVELRAAERTLKDLKAKENAGVHVLNQEPVADFTARVQAKAKERGLVEPGYRYAPGSDSGSYSPYTAGALNRAVEGNKKYTGSLFKTGQQNAREEAMHLGYARNIKRGINWQGVSDVWERNTPEWGRNQPLRKLENEIIDRKLNPDDWRYVDTGRFRKVSEDATPHENEDSGIHDAVVKHTFTLDGLPAEYAHTASRLSLVPAEVAKELEAGTRPSGELARIARKGMAAQSKVILNLNPTFVPIQVVANTPLAVLAMKGKVHDLVRGQRWYKGLDQEARDAVDDYIGVSATRAFTRGGRVGASASSNIGVFLEKVADNPKMRKAGMFNPMHINPMLDDAQNTFFRRAVFYNQAKRDAGRAMARDADGIVGDAKPLIQILKDPPGPERAAALRAATPQFERVGEKVDSMLGNYSRYSARERRFIRSNVLFYGFMRWSIQFAFYTLPVKHPVAASIGAKLGQLHNEEVISLLSSQGEQEGIAPKEKIEEVLREGASPYVFGRIWLKKNGKLESIDVARVNPLLNPVMDALDKGPFKAGLGLISPILQAGVDLAYGKDNFTGVDLKDSKGNTLSGAQDAAYIAGQTMRLGFPVRLADKLTHPGAQSADSIPLIAPKNQATSSTSAARAAVKKGERGSNREVALDSLLPLVRSKRDGTLRGLSKAVQDRAKKDAKRRGASAAPASVRGVPRRSALELLNVVRTAPGMPQRTADELTGR